MFNKIDNSDLLSPATIESVNITEIRRQKVMLKTSTLQNAILNSANFSSIAPTRKASFKSSMSVQNVCWDMKLLMS